MKLFGFTAQQETGSAGEQLAEQALSTAGLTLVSKNYRCRGGEIDLIMLDGKTLVFVEVRIRKNARFGSAEESITPRKQQRLKIAALHFLQHHKAYQQSPCRFDSYCVTAGQTQWLKNAFLT